jgi:hypothetical protein
VFPSTTSLCWRNPASLHSMIRPLVYCVLSVEVESALCPVVILLGLNLA